VLPPSGKSDGNSQDFNKAGANINERDSGNNTGDKTKNEDDQSHIDLMSKP